MARVTIKELENTIGEQKSLIETLELKAKELVSKNHDLEHSYDSMLANIDFISKNRDLVLERIKAYEEYVFIPATQKNMAYDAYNNPVYEEDTPRERMERAFINDIKHLISNLDNELPF